MDNKSNCLHTILQSRECTPNMIRNIIDIHPDSINEINSKGEIPLHTALRNSQHFELIDQLLKLGAKVNFPYKQNGEILPYPIYYNRSSPLHYAVTFLDEDAMLQVVQLLVKYGADVTFQYSIYKKPVHIVCDKATADRHFEVIRFLLKTEFDINCLDRYDQDYFNHLFKCEIRVIFEVMKMLLEFGVKPAKGLIHQALSLVKNSDSVCYAMKTVKLLMQYALIKEFRSDFSYDLRRAYHLRYQKCFCFDYSNPFHNDDFNEELYKYRDALVIDMNRMVEDKINKTSLFSIISSHCSSGPTYNKIDSPLLLKMLSRFHVNRYVCCEYLLMASIKQIDALFPILGNIKLFPKKHLSESTEHSSSDVKKLLPVDVILRIASYLSKEDILNLIFASWNPIRENENSGTPRSKLKIAPPNFNLF